MAYSDAFTSVLVPLDGSSFAEQALPLAAAIANRTGAELRLVLVHQSPPAPVTADAAQVYTSIEVALRRSEHGYLERMVEQVQREHQVKATPIVLAGAPGPTLERYVEELGIPLVVMSTHGRGGLQRAWLGSVADYLVRSLLVPVLLVRPCDGPATPRLGQENARILVALDGSAQSESVLEPAVELARAFDAEVSLIQVVLPLAFPFELAAAAAVGYDETLTQLQRQEAADYLSDMAEEIKAHGVRASCAAVLGAAVADTLLDLAAAEDVGLVALATHGRGGLPRLLLGSVADKMVRASGKPVLVYRPPVRRDGWQPRLRRR